MPKTNAGPLTNEMPVWYRAAKAMRAHPFNAAASDGPLRTNPVRCAATSTGTMEAFWAFGYGALGTRQLETETGITRFSLQTTVGGKEKLFLAALDQYLDISQQLIAPCMTDRSLDTIARLVRSQAEGRRSARRVLKRLYDDRRHGRVSRRQRGWHHRCQ